MKSTRRRAVNSGKVAGVAAGLMALAVVQSGSAFAAPKSDDQSAAGDIKIHNVGTGADDNANEPKVCAFTLVGDNFDADETISYDFVLGAPFKSSPALSGSLSADSSGSFSTATINLDPGQWKVFVDDGEDIKYKVFKVECDDTGTTDPGTPPTDPGTPPADPGTPPTDPGTPPADPGTPPADPGTPPADPGTPPADPGTPPADPGTPPADPGTPPADPGTPPADPGTPPADPGTPVLDGTPVTDPVSDPVITPVTDPVVAGGSTDQAGQPATPTVTGETSDGTVTGSWEVTGTSESADALPSTGSNATGIGMAGLILVGLGLALRRATKG